MIQRGKLIVLEGLDRSGKSSIASSLCELLSARGKTVPMGFPDRSTPIGKMIDEFLTSKTEICNEAIHLLFSANRWQNMKAMRQMLDSGTNVVCDRYWYSGVAYSMAKGMSGEWCSWADKGLLQPDLVIYLKASPQVLSKRANYGQQRFEKLQFQGKVKQNFEKLFQMHKGVRTVNVQEMQLKQVKQAVKEIVENLLK